MVYLIKKLLSFLYKRTFILGSEKIWVNVGNFVILRKATGRYRTYLSLVKLQPWFLSLQSKTCLGQNCNLGSCVWSERPALGQNTS